MKSWSIDKETGAVNAHDTHIEEEPACIFQPPFSDEPPPIFTEGRKYDNGKIDWTLLPFSSLEDAVRVLMFGADKYERENWKLVKNGSQRYTAACLRHLLKHMDGEEFDPETGLRHTAHAMVNLLFIEWLRKNGGK